MYITKDRMTEFEAWLRAADRAPATIRQYLRTIRRFAEHIGGRPATCGLLHEYKEKLKGSASPATVNTAIAASAFAGMAVTANAAEDTLYSVSTWTTDLMNAWTQTGTGTASLNLDTANNRIYYSPYKPGGAYSASYSVNVTSNAKITYDVDWYFGSPTGRSSNNNYIQFGDKLRFGWNQNGSTYGVYLSTDAGSNYGTTIFSGSKTTYTKHIQVVYDTSSNKIVSATFDGAEVTALTNLTINDFGAGKISFGFQRGGSTAQNNHICGIGPLTIKEEKQTVQTVDYTINYNYGG